MTYKVHIDRQALKEIKSLDKPTIKRIDDRIIELAINPYDNRISELIKMGTGERKSRVGDWRIIFEIDDGQMTIIILAVKHRRRAYPKQ